MSLIKSRKPTETWSIIFPDFKRGIGSDVVSVPSLFAAGHWRVCEYEDKFWVFHTALKLGMYTFDKLNQAKMLCKRFGEHVHLQHGVCQGLDSFIIVFSEQWSNNLLGFDPSSKSTMDTPGIWSTPDDDDIPF